MQKLLFGIFAHPDDEAFGPAGTLLTETKSGTELHLITLTAGEAGMNPDGVDNLADVRLDEWRAAGKLLGASSQHHLGYYDGTLGNDDHLHIADKIMHIVKTCINGRDDTIIEFISMDLNGVTGHIDHIVAGRSACLAFYRLKATGLPMSRIRLACLSRDQATEFNTDFCYMEAGHPLDEIDETVDARPLIKEIRTIMHCHYTQRSDAQAQIAALGDGIAVNHFIVQE